MRESLLAESAEITHLLNSPTLNRDSSHRLFELIYAQFHQMAARHLAGERGNHTLQPTVLVHDAYLELVNQESISWDGRNHFYGLASKVMRRILVNHARTRDRQKRGGQVDHIAISEVAEVKGLINNQDLIDLDRALEELAKYDQRKATIVEMRFFIGLSNQEICKILNIGKSTVKREWQFARVWLQRRLGDGSPFPIQSS